MKVAGIDYASAGISAIAIAVDGIPRSASIFQPDKNQSDVRSLLAYERWLTAKLSMLKPDLVVVEHLAVFHNTNVVRALSHREAICLLVAKKKAPVVIHRRITQARKIVFNKGNISKDDAWDVRVKHIEFDFGRKTTGGTDKMDAMTLALAGPQLVEISS